MVLKVREMKFRGLKRCEEGGLEASLIFIQGKGWGREEEDSAGPERPKWQFALRDLSA